LQFIRSFDI